MNKGGESLAINVEVVLEVCFNVVPTLGKDDSQGYATRARMIEVTRTLNSELQVSSMLDISENRLAILQHFLQIWSRKPCH